MKDQTGEAGAAWKKEGSDTDTTVSRSLGEYRATPLAVEPFSQKQPALNERATGTDAKLGEIPTLLINLSFLETEVGSFMWLVAYSASVISKPRFRAKANGVTLSLRLLAALRYSVVTGVLWGTEVGKHH